MNGFNDLAGNQRNVTMAAHGEIKCSIYPELRKRIRFDEARRGTDRREEHGTPPASNRQGLATVGGSITATSVNEHS